MKILPRLFRYMIILLSKNQKIKLFLLKINKNISINLQEKIAYLENLKFFFQVDLIIDIGVFKGTKELYSVFDNVDFHLIDPIKQKLSDTPKSYEFYEIGISSKIGEFKFYEYENGGMSTFYDELKLGRSYEGKIKSKKLIPTLTLDAFIEKNCSKYQNIGLKIDAQGSELDIISSLKKMSEKIDFIIIENNITNRYNNDSHFSSCTSLLYEKGFRFLNLVEPSTANFQHCYDCVYIKENNRIFSSTI